MDRTVSELALVSLPALGRQPPGHTSDFLLLVQLSGVHFVGLCAPIFGNMG